MVAVTQSSSKKKELCGFLLAITEGVGYLLKVQEDRTAIHP